MSRIVTGRALAWMLWTATVLLLVAAIAMPRTNSNEESLSLLSLLIVQAATFATVGLVLVRARPRNAVSWLFCTVALFVALYLAAERYQYYGLVVHPGELPLAELAAWLQTWLYVPALGICVTFLPQLFPTGRPISRRWYAGLVLAGAAFVGMCLTDALRPGRMDQSTIANPVGISPSSHDVLSEVAFAVYMLATLVGFASLVVRWRQATPAQRQQLKWFAYFASLIPLFVVISGVRQVLPLGEVWVYVTATGAFLGLPIGTAISILRYQLYDIDLVINRTLVYGTLTVLLAASYLGLVLLFQLVLGPVTQESDLAVAGSTLAVASLFRPVRGRVQAVVNRRFYRSSYDASQTLQAFAGRLREELDLETLGTDLHQVVHETMQPSHVSLWLRSSR